MRLGVYTAVLHDRPLGEALDIVAALGLGGVEVNAGGFLRTPHLPVDVLLADAGARSAYLAEYHRRGLELTALNVNGNPVHPQAAIGGPQADELRAAIRLAPLLGVERVVTMSGLPAGEPGGTVPSWAVNPWHSAYSDVLDYQWGEVIVPFWHEIDGLAREHGVTVCLEMHPHNVVFNPATLTRLVELTGATQLRAELDPSHLFWQGIDPVAAIEHLGPLVGNAAAKDTRINPSSRVFGVLDDRFRRVPEGESPLHLDGPYTLNEKAPDASWDFVAVGRGHDVEFWARFLRALEAVDPDMPVNIEHEDAELGRVEGLEVAAETLIAARDLLSAG
jgi:sugar phosphate isomerase/epimerase